MIEFEKVIDAITITQKFFAHSLCGKYVNYTASGKRTLTMELDDVHVHCFFNDDEFDIMISTEEIVINGDNVSVSGVIYE